MTLSGVRSGGYCYVATMSAAAISQLVLFAAEAVLVCGVLLWFFHLRHRFGNALLYITLGTFQYLQMLMAATVYVEVFPGIVVSPGSAVLFTATLFAVLLVYIREDAAEARSLIVGVVGANLTLSLILKLASLHLGSGLLVGASTQSSYLLDWDALTFVIGTGTMVLDVVLIIVLYEFFFRVFPRSLFARVWASMLIVVAIDTGLFVTASFAGHPDFVQILTSGFVAKLAAATVYALLLTGYLLLVRSPQQDDDALGETGVRDIFHILTYKQRFQMLEHEIHRDSLSGLFNRRFFDQNLRRELDRAKRLQHTLNLILLDIDHFKAINDTHGHQVGDQAIMALAESMREAFRNADILCRYGGEEFAAIMPDSSIDAAFRATQALQQAYPRTCRARGLPIADNVTFTAGIASYPVDGTMAEELVRMADARLYKGKNRGRNRVIIDTMTMRAIDSP